MEIQEKWEINTNQTKKIHSGITGKSGMTAHLAEKSAEGQQWPRAMTLNRKSPSVPVSHEIR
jgi:hypothetical protein